MNNGSSVKCVIVEIYIIDCNHKTNINNIYVDKEIMNCRKVLNFCSEGVRV